MSRPLSQIRPAPRRGLSRDEAAMYVGISPAKFDELVTSEKMPRARLIDRRKAWDIHMLDVAFDRLPIEDSPAIGTGWEDVA